MVKRPTSNEEGKEERREGKDRPVGGLVGWFDSKGSVGLTTGI